MGAGGAPRIGVVVIGRNEGERLTRCLAAVQGGGYPIVYVDSGSSDDSVARARAASVDVVELSADRPFSAARGRNEGFAFLRARVPGLPFVQFVDGDCVLVTDWLETAVAFFDANGDAAALVGQLSELDERRNIYHRLCAMEWKGGTGDIRNSDHFGGISAVRADAFEAIGGFDPALVAGEDPDMAARLLLAGRRITKLGDPMAIHDADMSSFRQFWIRAVRAGHGAAQRSTMREQAKLSDAARTLRSMAFWGAALPGAAIVAAPFTDGLSLGVLGGAYGVLVLRVARHRRRMADSWPDSLLYGVAIVVMKVAGVVGLVTFFRRRRRSGVRLIEYK